MFETVHDFIPLRSGLDIFTKEKLEQIVLESQKIFLNLYVL